jgi:RNA polymerase sigma-54 factor
MLKGTLRPDQSLQTILAPVLQDGLEILRLTTLQLIKKIEEELVENPALERIDSEEESMVTLPDRPESQISDWQSFLENLEMESLRQYSSPEDSNVSFIENIKARRVSLRTHLLDQLKFYVSSDKEMKIAECLIDNIDEDGYLIKDIEEIAQITNQNINEVDAVLKKVQENLEPSGICARNIQECLLIQAKDLDLLTPLLEKIVKDHLNDFQANRYANIMRSLNISKGELAEAVFMLKQLDPKPGRLYSGNENPYIMPDVLVSKIGEEVIVVMNEKSVPNLRVSNYFQSLLQEELDERTKSFVREKLNKALLFLKQIEQRRSTLLKVSKEIFEYQKDFLDGGPTKLKPLKLEDISERVGLHKTTVSRATTNKYAHTPWGVFELKYFFGVGYKSYDMDKVHAEAIREQIKMLIEKEDKASPLRDEQICEILEKRGIKIARRTVAKYRKDLKILSAPYRKSKTT